MTTTESRPETLEDILYHLTVLHERWAAEKHDFTKQVIKVDQLIKEFTVRINQLDERQSSTEEKMVSAVKSTARQVYSTIEESVKKSMDTEIKKTVNHFDNVVGASRYQLERWQKESEGSVFWGGVIAIGASLVSSFILSFLMVKLLLPPPVLPLTNDQFDELRGGQMMAFMWPKLSKQDQTMLLQIEDKVLKESTENVTDDDIEHNPNWWLGNH